MRRVLLTGGAGFIGRGLARALTASGWSVRALDNFDPQVHQDPERSADLFAGEVVHGDVRDAPTVARAVRDCDAVVHLAAATGVSQSMYSAGRYRATNVVGSANVARAAARGGAALALCSSRAVYGEGAYSCPACGVTYGSRCCERALPRAARESDPVLPVSVYGETKAEAEAVVQEGWPGDLPLLVLRPQNVVGAGSALANPYAGVLAAFAARLQAGLPMQVFGTGLQTRDIVHLADMVEFVSWALDHLDAWRGPLVLNVGTGARTTLDELARATARARVGRPAGIEHLDVRRPGDIEHACADMTRAARHGAPIPRRPAQMAVEEFIAWALRQPAASPTLWDQALDELAEEGLLNRGGP